MKNRDCPNLIIITGPHGAGKSTVADFLLSNESIKGYSNADVISKGMAFDEGNSSSEISAGRILLKLVHDAIARRQTIAFETTMSGLIWKRLIGRAKNAGFEVTICYVAVCDPLISIKRVAQRVREGGHDIPRDTIERRYRKSLALAFSQYYPLADYWYFFDNSGDSAQLLALREKGESLTVLNDLLWGDYAGRFR